MLTLKHLPMPKHYPMPMVKVKHYLMLTHLH
jgi:hypothetical protein